MTLAGYHIMATGQTITPLQDYQNTRVTVYMGFVSFMILAWDHIITLDDEVKYIWFGHKGLLVWLFFINRYLTPFGFIINLFAYLSPSWTAERCQDFVRYEGSMTVIGLNTTALMMFLRIYALYRGQIIVLVTVAVMFSVELGVNAWLLSHGIAVPHSDGIKACTMIFDSSVGPIASASAWLPLLYDTLILALTLNRTVKAIRQRTAGKIMRVLMRDGILYYSVIFAVNVVLTFMIAFAPPDIQNITAQLEYLLTVAMMSRITIHLKKQRHPTEVVELGPAGTQIVRGSSIFHPHLHSALTFAKDLVSTTSSSSKHTKSPTTSSFSNHFHHSRSQRAQNVMNPQVTITIEELVVRDDEDDHSGNLSDASSSYGNERKARSEWHEMRDVTPPSSSKDITDNNV